MSGGEERRIGERGEQKRRWDLDNRLPCGVCGEPTSKRGAVNGRVIRCEAHALHHERAAARRARIVELWARGLTHLEIADDLQTTEGTVGVEMVRMRRAGYDLPRRHRTSLSMD